MAMYICIGRNSGWSTSGGVFDCIVESTRGLFKNNEKHCLSDIYSPLDDQGQSLIALDIVDEICFNLFYSYCESAMNDFPLSDRAERVPRSHIPGILWNWSEVLQLMREDPRYRDTS